MNVEKRIEYFNWVRDIPYIIGLNGETDYCCSTKAKFLAKLLGNLGLKTREIICEFEWAKSLPVEIYSPEKTIEVSHRHNDPQAIKNHFEYHNDFYSAINNWMMKARVK